MFQILDLPLVNQFDIVDPATFVAAELISFSQTVNFYLALILGLVIWLAFSSYTISNYLITSENPFW
jgi:hypothetical protein